MNKFFPLLFVLIATCSCNNLDNVDQGRIGVRVAVDGTRALIDNESIKTDGFVSAAYAEQSWHDNLIADGEVGSASNEYVAGLYFTESVNYDSSASKWSFASEQKWLNGIPLTFWSWNSSASDNISNKDYSVGSGVFFFDYAIGDTSAADDFVMAYNGEKRTFKGDGAIDESNCSGTRTDGQIDVHFYHGLSEINFMVCTDESEGSFDPSLVIKSLGFSNLVSAASCVFTGSTHDFDWTLGSDVAAFTRNFGAQTGTGSSWTDKTVDSKTYRKTGSSFYFIPQTCGSDTKLILTLADDTTREVSVSGMEWLPGKYYTYKLEAHAKSIDFTAKLIDWGEGGTYTLTK